MLAPRLDPFLPQTCGAICPGGGPPRATCQFDMARLVSTGVAGTTLSMIDSATFTAPSEASFLALSTTPTRNRPSWLRFCAMFGCRLLCLLCLSCQMLLVQSSHKEEQIARLFFCEAVSDSVVTHGTPRNRCSTLSFAVQIEKRIQKQLKARTEFWWACEGVRNRQTFSHKLLDDIALDWRNVEQIHQNLYEFPASSRRSSIWNRVMFFARSTRSS